jgi:excisionase family DNA binding protein
MRPYSPETLATHWGCSSEKIRQMCRRGELGYFRLGKLIRIPANEVERVECQNTALCGTESNGASPTPDREAAFESRLERLTGESPRLALVRSGAPAQSPSPRG